MLYNHHQHSYGALYRPYLVAPHNVQGEEDDGLMIKMVPLLVTIWAFKQSLVRHISSSPAYCLRHVRYGRSNHWLLTFAFHSFTPAQRLYHKDRGAYIYSFKSECGCLSWDVHGAIDNQERCFRTSFDVLLASGCHFRYTQNLAFAYYSSGLIMYRLATTRTSFSSPHPP